MKSKKKLIYTLILFALFLGPLYAIQWLETPHSPLMDPSAQQEYIIQISNNTKTTLNPITHLYLQPSVDDIYYALASYDMITHRTAPLFNLTSSINTSLITYLWNNFNPNDGGYAVSDVGGVYGDVKATYQALYVLNKLDPSFLHKLENQAKLTLIKQFYKDCLGNSSFGFVPVPHVLSYSTMESTYYALKGMDLLGEDWFKHDILINTTQWVKYTVNEDEGGTKEDNLVDHADIVSTAYAILIRLRLEAPLRTEEKTKVGNFLFNNFQMDGGFSNHLGEGSSLKASYFAYLIDDLLEFSTINPLSLSNFAFQCQRDNLGFSDNPYPEITNQSDFESAYYAILIANLTNTWPIDNWNNYSQWFAQHQTQSGLFGHYSVEANYHALNLLYLGGQIFDNASLAAHLSLENLTAFLGSCYDFEELGYRSAPERNTSLKVTWEITQIGKVLQNLHAADPSVNFSWNDLHSENLTCYFLNRLNPDGGFQIGEDLWELGELFPLNRESRGNVDGNTSFISSTYWALSGLQTLNYLTDPLKTNVSRYIRASQNLDGGFGFALGEDSNIYSTFYATRGLNLVNGSVPSISSMVDFVAGAQQSIGQQDGGFNNFPNSVKIDNFDKHSRNEINLYAIRLLVENFAYPENISGFKERLFGSFNDCVDGIGIYSESTADPQTEITFLNSIVDLSTSQSFDPEKWVDLLRTFLLVELILVVVFMIILVSSKIIALFRTTSYDVDVGYLTKYPALEVINLTVYAGLQPIISNVNLNLKAGEILGVLGESGAGKSTFIKAVLGMRKFMGMNYVFGLDTQKKQNAARLRPVYGYVPQDLSKIYDNFSVIQNLVIFGQQYGLKEKQIRIRGRRVLKALGIAAKTNELVRNLSGGQKRRVSIAIALVHEPILLILDEPTSGLDPVVRQSLWLSLVQLNKQFNTTLIVVTHYPEESKFCHKVALFGRGRGLIDYGSPESLIAQLPGGGRAIHLILKRPIVNALDHLNSMFKDTSIMEEKNGQQYLLLTAIPLNVILDELNNPNSPFHEEIEDLSNIDAQMEQFFRFRFMEVHQE